MNDRDIRDEKIDSENIDVTGNNRFLKWLDNFWYHYKWTLIIVVFIVAVITIAVVQMVTKTEADVKITFGGPYIMSESEVSSVRNDLSSLLKDDVNGDGKKYVDFYEYAVYSEDQIKSENERETNESGKYVTNINPSYTNSRAEAYQSYVQTGDCSIYFVSGYLYENLIENNRLRPLSETFGSNIPDNIKSFDGYGVRLGDTDLYKYFDSLKALPKDTVICLMRPYVFGESSKEKNYSATVDFYKALLQFEIQN